MKRILSGILTVALLITSLSITAFAEPEDRDPANGKFFVSFEAGEDEYTGASVLAGPALSTQDAVEPGVEIGFVADTEYKFILDPPASRQGKEPLVEIIRMGPTGEKTPLNTWEETLTLTGNDDKYEFTFTVTDELWFKVNVWWSDYDRTWQEEGQSFLQLDIDGWGWIEMDETGLADGDYSQVYEREMPDGEGGTRGEGNRKINIDPAKKNRSLTFMACEGWYLERIELNDGEPIMAEDLFDGENYVYTTKSSDWNADDRLKVTAFYFEEADPERESLEEMLSEKEFYFGDWDGENGTTADDIVTGIRDMVYYPYFSQNPDRCAKYGLDGPGDIAVTVTPSAKTMDVKDRYGNTLPIPLYDYELTFTPQENPEDAEVFTGEAGLFVFAGVSEDDFIVKYSDENVIMEAWTGETYARTIKNTHYGSPDNADLITGKTGEEAPEGSYIFYSDYDVVFFDDDSALRRLRIYGNGADLDACFSNYYDTGYALFQGRNEDLVRDSGHGTTIFGTFTFIQPGTYTASVKGTEAAGSTPAWAYSNSPIASITETAAEANEVEAYFGCASFDIQPGIYGTGVEKITNIQPVGDIPENALVITNYEAEGRWNVKFLSDYYDTVTFKFSMAKEVGSAEGYITLHRVGIDINTAGIGADDREQGFKTLLHGTTNGPDYYFEDGTRYILYATYYYPEDGGTEELVDLYVTLTWASGKVTRKLIENSADLNLDWHHEYDNVQTSDFIIYEGTEAGAPVKAEVIAIKAGSDEETFAGARLGAGRGVVWEAK